MLTRNHFMKMQNFNLSPNNLLLFCILVEEVQGSKKFNFPTLFFFTFNIFFNCVSPFLFSLASILIVRFIYRDLATAADSIYPQHKSKISFVDIVDVSKGKIHFDIDICKSTCSCIEYHLFHISTMTP